MRKYNSFAAYKKELFAKDPKAKIAYEIEYRKLLQTHSIIEKYMDAIEIAKAAWDELQKDTDCSKYMKETKITRPKGWDGK